MAKKAVATLHEGSKEGRSYTKVIKMVKSPKTGAYIFVPVAVDQRKVRVDRQSIDGKLHSPHSGA